MKNLDKNLSIFFSPLEITDEIDNEAIKKCFELYCNGILPQDINPESDDTQFEYLGLMSYVIEHFGDEIRTKAEKSIIKKATKILYKSL